MHWKIARDPYFAALHRKWGEAAVWQAGFFCDDDPNDAPLDDVDWLCTPRPKLPATGSRPAVLLATGAFCPVHDGHLAMMEQARIAATGAGFEIVGGYLSPGHARYIETKCGDAAIPVVERLLQCAAIAEESKWLSVDPWEAVHRRVAVNFTDVTARLRNYLHRHVHPHMEVIYVCGADNARFAYAFAEFGYAVVVQRPGFEVEMEKWRRRLSSYSNLSWAEGTHTGASSTIRKERWVSQGKRRLAVRLEDQRAVRTLNLSNYASFQRELVELLSRNVSVRTVRMAEQPEPPADAPIISLDPMLPRKENLAISRLFAMGGYESLGHVARPGAEPLAEQVSRIPVGSYELRDDDRMTGKTLEAVRLLLPPGISIHATHMAMEPKESEDIADARDFLLGADDGGLVVALPAGGVGRVPYLLPYVDPAARASLAAAHWFSSEVWLLNARSFAGTNLRISDLPPANRAVFASWSNQTLEEVCLWHAQQLRALG